MKNLSPLCFVEYNTNQCNRYIHMLNSVRQNRKDFDTDLMS